MAKLPAAASVIVGLIAATSQVSAVIVVSGGGDKRSDCFVGFEVAGEGDLRPIRDDNLAVVGAEQEASGGSCTFKVKVCINEAAAQLRKCTPARIRRIRQSGKGFPSPPLGGSLHVCGEEADVTLSLKGKKPRSRVFTMVGVAAKGRPRQDSDRLRLVCLPPAVCGNGVLEGGEECDDNNSFDGDGCDSNCTPTRCGNGIVTAGECEPPGSQAQCAADELCDANCTCVKRPECECGDSVPGELEVTTRGAGGTCGMVQDDAGADVLDLTCGGIYFGGGSGIQPAIVPSGVRFASRTVCHGRTLTITSAGPGDPGFGQQPCTAAGCFFGPPLPIPNTGPSGVSACVINKLRQPIVGSADCITGEMSGLDLFVDSDVLLAGDILPFRCTGGPRAGESCAGESDPSCAPGACLRDDGIQPCPICNPTTGKCNGGPNEGMACEPGSLGSGDDHPTSHDCPPSENGRLGVLPIRFALTTATITRSAINGAQNPGVFCGFCGKRAIPTFEKPARACSGDADCSTVDFPSCQQRGPGAFSQSAASRIIQTGTPGGDLTDRSAHDTTLVGFACIPGTSSIAFDNVVSLPGPAAVSFVGTIQVLPSR